MTQEKLISISKDEFKHTVINVNNLMPNVSPR